MEYLLVSPQNPRTSHPFEKGLQNRRQRTYFPSVGKGFVFDLMRFRASQSCLQEGSLDFLMISACVHPYLFTTSPCASHSTAFRHSFAGITALVDLHKRRLEPSVRKDQIPDQVAVAGHVVWSFYGFIYLHIIFSYHSSGESLHSKGFCKCRQQTPSPSMCCLSSWSF